MKAILLTGGIFLCVAGGEFLKIGSSIAASLGIPASQVPSWAPFAVIALGCAAIVQTCFETLPPPD